MIFIKCGKINLYNYENRRDTSILIVKIKAIDLYLYGNVKDHRQWYPCIEYQGDYVVK